MNDDGETSPKDTSVRPQRPTSMQNITLTTCDFTNSDYFSQKSICIPYGSKICQMVQDNYTVKMKSTVQIPEDAYDVILEDKYLIGQIGQKVLKSQLYEVQFSYSSLPKMKFDYSILLQLVEDYRKYINRKKLKNKINLDESIMTPDKSISSPNASQNKPPQGVRKFDDTPKWMKISTWKKLINVQDGEEGIPVPSDDDISHGGDGDIDCDEEDDIISGLIKEKIYQNMYDDSNDDLGHAEDVDGVKWDFSNAPVEKTVISDYGPTQLKAEYKRCFFNTPMISLLKFIPVSIWQVIVKESNDYAHLKMSDQNVSTKLIAGKPWSHDLTLSELMQFIGIMLHLALRPSPGRTYTYAWDDHSWHPYTKHMKCHRFTQIRAVLHLCDNSHPRCQMDSLSKVRPLLNALKLTAGWYVHVGCNIALDETSIASRSKYGRNFIYFNSTKNTGKFHFRFYMLFCSTTHMLLAFKMNSNDNSDYSNIETGVVNQSLSVYEENSSEFKSGEDTCRLQRQKTSNLVVEIVKPYHGTGRIINMDRYYGSCISVMNLKRVGLYAHCTTKENVKHFPSSIAYNKNEISKYGRGSYRYASEGRYGMVTFSWCDCKPVNMITTADGSCIGQVSRQIGQSKCLVQAPQAVYEYNKNMDAVDRWDQKLTKFALHKRHKFKKYYRNIMMILIDFGILQADIHYHLAHPELSESNRVEFYENMADELINTYWSKLVNDFMISHEMMDEVDESDDFFMEDIGCNPSNMINSRINIEINSIQSGMCVPIATSSISKSTDGQSCQICKFEGRGRKTSYVVFCQKHKVRCCVGTHEEEINTNMSINKFKKVSCGLLDCSDWSWMCPNHDWTCWKKYHDYYYPKHLFSNPKPNSSPTCSCQVNKTNVQFLNQRKAIDQPYVRKRKPQDHMTSPSDSILSTNQIITGRRSLQEDLNQYNSTSV